MQAESLIGHGKLVVLAPEHDLMVDLYWHHRESEPEPLAKLNALIVHGARQSLIQPAPMGKDAVARSSCIGRDGERM